MFTTPATLILSATDLANYLACGHLSHLDLAVAFGAPRPPVFDDPSLETLRARGLQHEAEFRAQLERDGLGIVEIQTASRDGGGSLEERYHRGAAATLDAMRAGADVIYQGTLFDGTWLGRPDFLRRVERPSDLGGWSYEVIDAKLASEAKGGALLQVLLYADLLERAQGVAPEHVHLALGGPEPRLESFRTGEYAAYFRLLKRDFLAHLDAAADPLPTSPEPVEHCDVCAWRMRCDEERRTADHLSLVAGITRRQREALEPSGVHTLEQLATLGLPLDPPLDRVSPASLERVREQARIQLAGRLSGEPRHELMLPIVPGEGLAALPEPSPGDLFLDLEGNPYALTYGLEYLFGVVDADGGYTGAWALDRAAEKQVFEGFIDTVMERFERFPGLHVYHYAPYEPGAMKRLMGFHATREAEVDHLLRAGIFVDLYRVVRQGLRASVESYSIKKLERFYGYTRTMDLREASGALHRFDALLEVGLYEEEREALARVVEEYNRDDCVSTLRLRNWLEALREEMAAAIGGPVPRPLPADGALTEDREARDAEIAARIDALTAGVPADPELRTPEEQGRWLLAQLIEFHRRENKASWWEYFRCLSLTAEEMLEDRATLGGLEYVGVVDTVARSEIHRYRFPPQEHGIRSDARDPATEKSPGVIVEIDDANGFIHLKRGRNSEVPHPAALVPLDQVPDKVLRESILRVADEVIDHALTGGFPARSAVDLLLRIPPRVAGGGATELMIAGEAPLDAATRLVTQLDGTVLPIQGPPGSGKTFTAAAMVVRALDQGKRVGVTATSHKVISNLLTAVCEAADRAGVRLAGIQKGDEEQWCGDNRIRAESDNGAVAEALRTGAVNLAAGTAWLWSREEMMGAVDLLFIDEAGQFSLANALAVSPAADSLVLLGDPRQLEQPQQGVHPPGADLSALDHLLAGETTIAADRGLFLERTWRLHPTICAFTSEIFYDGRLESRAGLDVQEVRGPGLLNGSGLRLITVSHEGNQSESPEEADVVAELVVRLTSSCSWIDEKLVERPVTLADVLVVAPYNAQVSAIASLLPAGSRVGTVDKFQGQEAPVVIYSVTTSSAADAPRGMEFLYSPNRLNVATSRARCLAIAVASPDVFVPDCRTPGQMKLANAFCRFRELATESAWDGSAIAAEAGGSFLTLS
jgi:uncharacterized protein